MLQIPEIYTSKASVHRNGVTARESIILRVTKIGAIYKICCVVFHENGLIEKNTYVYIIKITKIG